MSNETPLVGEPGLAVCGLVVAGSGGSALGVPLACRGIGGVSSATVSSTRATDPRSAIYAERAAVDPEAHPDTRIAAEGIAPVGACVRTAGEESDGDPHGRRGASSSSGSIPARLPELTTEGSTFNMGGRLPILCFDQSPLLDGRRWDRTLAQVPIPCGHEGRPGCLAVVPDNASDHVGRSALALNPRKQ